MWGWMTAITNFMACDLFSRSEHLHAELGEHGSLPRQAGTAERGIRADRGQKHAGRAANAVHGKNVERVIDLQARLHETHAEETDGAGNEPDEQGSGGPDKTGSGRDRRESRD